MTKWFKLLAIISAFALCFAFAGCGTAGGASDGEPGDNYDLDPQTEDQTPVTPQEEEVTDGAVVDDAVCTITVNSKGIDENGDPYFNLTITNNSDVAIDVTNQSETFAVNGMMADPFLYETVQPGKYTTVDMYFDSDLVPFTIDEFASVEGIIRVMDTATFETLGTYEFAYHDDTIVVPEMDHEGTTVVDDDTCTVVFMDKAVDFAGDPGYNVYVKNNTDVSLYFTPQVGSFSVNGQMNTAYGGKTVAPGCYAIFFLYFDPEDLGGGVETLVNVEGVLQVLDGQTRDQVTTYSVSV